MIFLLVPILAILPAIFWLFIFLREDKADPEPKKFILMLFFIGAVFGLVAAILEFSSSFILPTPLNVVVEDFFSDPTPGSLSLSLVIFMILAVMLFAAIEEVLKITVVKEFAFYHPHFRQVVDGAIFGVSAGLG